MFVRSDTGFDGPCIQVDNVASLRDRTGNPLVFAFGAQLIGGNTFSGDQTINGNLSVFGTTVTNGSLDVAGSTVGGANRWQLIAENVASGNLIIRSQNSGLGMSLNAITGTLSADSLGTHRFGPGFVSTVEMTAGVVRAITGGGSWTEMTGLGLRSSGTLYLDAGATSGIMIRTNNANQNVVQFAADGRSTFYGPMTHLGTAGSSATASYSDAWAELRQTNSYVGNDIYGGYAWYATLTGGAQQRILGLSGLGDLTAYGSITGTILQNDTVKIKPSGSGYSGYVEWYNPTTSVRQGYMGFSNGTGITIQSPSTVYVDAPVLSINGNVAAVGDIIASRLAHSEQVSMIVTNDGYLAGSTAAVVLNAKWTNGGNYPVVIKNAPDAVGSLLKIDSRLEVAGNITASGDLTASGSYSGFGTTSPSTYMAGVPGVAIYSASNAGIAVANASRSYLWYVNGTSLKLYDNTGDRIEVTNSVITLNAATVAVNGNITAGAVTAIGTITLTSALHGTSTLSLLSGNFLTSAGLNAVGSITWGNGWGTLSGGSGGNVVISSAGATEIILGKKTTASAGFDVTGNLTASGSITGSNLSGTNTGDKTLSQLLPTMTGQSGKYLTNNGTVESWGTVVAPTWGAITGTLASQADLQAALNLKAPLASPTFTGTVSAAAITASGQLAVNSIVKDTAGVQELLSIGRVSQGLAVSNGIAVTDNGYGYYSFSTTAGAAFRADAAGVAITSAFNGISLGNNRSLNWSPTTEWYDTSDVRISRASAGVLQLGTTANNALGSLACAAITATGAVTISNGSTAPLTVSEGSMGGQAITCNGSSILIALTRIGMVSIGLGTSNGDSFRVSNIGDSTAMLTIHATTKLATFPGAITASGTVTTPVIQIGNISGYIAAGSALFVSGANASNDFAIRAQNKFGIAVGGSNVPCFTIDAAGAITASGIVTATVIDAASVASSYAAGYLKLAANIGIDVYQGATIQARIGNAQVGIGNNSLTGGTSVGFRDVGISRQSAGVWQLETTSQNALGSLACAAITASGTVSAPTVKLGSAALYPSLDVIGGGTVRLMFDTTLVGDGLSIRGTDGATYVTLGGSGVYVRGFMAGLISDGTTGILNIGGGQMYVTHAAGNRSIVKTYGNLELQPGGLTSGPGTYVEINNGTAGTYRDLKCRDVTASGTVTSTGLIATNAGISTTLAKVGGKIFDFFTDSSVGGAEADIYSSTTATNTLSTNGNSLTASYGGNFVTVGTELTQLKVYFGGTAIWDSTALAPATGTTSWRVGVEIIRVSATVVRYTVSLNTSGAAGYVYCTSGELTGLTLSATNVLKITGVSSGVGSGAGDIVGKMGSVSWLPAA